MSKEKKNSHMIELLADSLVEDILNASDEDILSEAQGDSIDPKLEADKARALFDQTRIILGKKRLNSAKEELTKKKHNESRKIINLNPNEARKRLHKILAQCPEETTNITLAARDERELSDNDVLEMLEDLETLGVPTSSSERDEE